MAKNIIINGVNGQDGAYLAKQLINDGHKIYGGVRDAAKPGSNLNNLKELGILDQIDIIEFGLTDTNIIGNAIKSIKPDEFYNLAALSSVNKSWEFPEETFDTNATGVVRILDSLKYNSPKSRYFQASSSEIFGNSAQPIQDESTAFCPANPYGISKLAAYFTVKSYRDSCGIFASNGILFNHESPLRPETYVSRKITKALVEISLGRETPLRLGNLEVKRDWGYAPDFIRGMIEILNYHEPLDVILATGITHSIREFVEVAANHLDIEIEWTGSGINEVGKDVNTGKVIVEVDSKFYRPIDTKQTCGNSQKAKEKIGWVADVQIVELASKMIEHDKIKLTGKKAPKQ